MGIQNREVSVKNVLPTSQHCSLPIIILVSVKCTQQLLFDRMRHQLKGRKLLEILFVMIKVLFVKRICHQNTGDCTKLLSQLVERPTKQLDGPGKYCVLCGTSTSFSFFSRVVNSSEDVCRRRKECPNAFRETTSSFVKVGHHVSSCTKLEK